MAVSMGILEQDSLSIASFTFAAIYVFLPSVPVTHCLGLVAHLPASAKAKHLLLYPFKGGRHHFIFQVIAWVRVTSLQQASSDCVLRPIGPYLPSWQIMENNACP